MKHNAWWNFVLISSGYAVKVRMTPTSRRWTAMVRCTSPGSTTANLWCWNGTTMVAHTRRNTTRVETCSGCRRNGQSKGVVWLTVISSAPNEQGYVTAKQENDYMSRLKAGQRLRYWDFQGDVGKLTPPRPRRICLS